MRSRDQMSELLKAQIVNANTQWSLGTFGGIAEFSRDAREPVKIAASESQVSAATERGAVAIRLVEGMRPLASESISKLDWSHRIALCLPKGACEMNQRTTLTELGPDFDASRVLLDVICQRADWGRQRGRES